MITKLALLPRMLPGLFRRLPAVTSVGYLMPHTRYLFAGLSCSAALHAAVLFGINPPIRVPNEPAGPVEKVIGPISFGPVAEEPPPPPPELASKKSEDEPNPREAGEDSARFPEPIGRPIGTDFVAMKVEFDVGKLPNAGDGRWKVPHNSGPGAGAKIGDRVYNPVDLDKIPVATSRISPRYPFELKRSGMDGTVVLRFVVDSRGTVSDVEVVSADHPEFGRAAAEAMLRWKFKAGMKDGRRVPTRMEMPMTFAVSRDT